MTKNILWMLAVILTAHGCTVKTEFGDWSNHVNYGLFQHIGATILQMEEFMLGSDEIKKQLKEDFINKVTEYIKEETNDFTSISL